MVSTESVLMKIADKFLQCDVVPHAQWQAYKTLKISAAVMPRLPGEPSGLAPTQSGTVVDKSKDADDTAEIRTLWVDMDEQGEQYKDWKTFCRGSYAVNLSSKPSPGPVTVLHFCKHCSRQGGGPRL